MRRRQIFAIRQQEADREVMHYEKQAEEADAGQGRAEVLIDADGAKACPKCGKSLGRGAHFHVRACKG